MREFFIPLWIVLFSIVSFSCQAKSNKSENVISIDEIIETEAKLDHVKDVVIGALDTVSYYAQLKNKRIAILSNNTGLVNKNEHLLDMLLKDGFNVVTLFSPEHGFRGDADAGEKVKSSVDTKTGIPISSLYNGKGYKPSKEVMDQFDVLVFDIQDVGLRFYTYYITMARLMEACAESGKEMIVLDRPNPNGFYVDGPILDMKHKSGIGWLPIPVVHGMTLAELAQMINGEKWLANGIQCDLTVVLCQNYTHQTRYKLPISPSPNLKNMHAIYLYPAVCLFEGTPVSLGRGTEYPFEIYGHPDMSGYSFSFTPESLPGAKNPPLLGKKCYGVDLRNVSDDEIIARGFHVEYIIDAYNNLNIGDKFMTSFFEKLVGVDYIRKMIVAGKSADEIKQMWQGDVVKFKKARKPYLLYEE